MKDTILINIYLKRINFFKFSLKIICIFVINFNYNHNGISNEYLNASFIMTIFVLFIIFQTLSVIKLQYDMEKCNAVN